jgi:hypothetical protein
LPATAINYRVYAWLHFEKQNMNIVHLLQWVSPENGKFPGVKSVETRIAGSSAAATLAACTGTRR